MNYHGTQTGRFSSNPLKPGDRVSVSGLPRNATVVEDHGEQFVRIRMDGAPVDSFIARTLVEALDLITELGDLAR